MAFAPLAWLGAGLGVATYAPDVLGKGSNKKQEQNNYAQPPVYQIQQAPQGFGLGSLFTAVCIGGGVVIFFGAYKYFYGSNPLDKILPELEESSRKTLEQVRKADENSRIRAQQMDENNRQRLMELQAEMQSEHRGNFEVLSEQINCLTQIALQTLTTVSPNEQLAITGGNVDDQQLAAIQNQRGEINEFARRAQEVADEIADPAYHEQKRRDASKRIRATIPGMNAIKDSSQNTTMQGPHDLNDHQRGGRRKKKEGGSSYLGALGRGLGLI